MENPDGIDLRKLAAEIEAEVRARRAAGDYPPGFEDELDALFDRYAPPEVNEDFDAALERAEDLSLINPVLPVASRNPILGVVKRTVAKLIAWYHSFIAQQVGTLAGAINNALGLLYTRVRNLERTTGDVRAQRAVMARIPAHRDDAAWQSIVVDSLRGREGRVAVVHCGRGALLEGLGEAGVDAYGIEPRRGDADEARSLGFDVRIDDGIPHLESVGEGALSGLVVRGLSERSMVSELVSLVASAHDALAEGAPILVCSLRRNAWGHGDTLVEADLVAGRPLEAESWVHLLGEYGFADASVKAAGDAAYVVCAVRGPA
jgi:hypothetical protein